MNMQYILSEEEYKSLIPSKEYEKVRNSLLEENAELENIINQLKSELVKKNPWISIDEKFPEDKCPVLCSSSIYGKVVLCWDELSQSWNYPESGEFYCDWDKVDCWMPIPEV